MKTKYLSILIFFLVFNGCSKDEPPPIVPPPPPTVVNDTIALTQGYITGRSITVNIKTTSYNTKSNIKLIRKIDVFEELLAEYAILIKDTSIIDDNDGAGLLLDTTYTYFAIRVDSTGEDKDTVTYWRLGNSHQQVTITPGLNIQWVSFRASCLMFGVRMRIMFGL